MKRRRLVLPLVVSAALAAVALPIVALAAPDGVELPDLRADAPENPELQVYDDGRLLLRFDGFVTNVGRGPLDIDGNPGAGRMFQDFRYPDGSWESEGGGETRPVEVKYETTDGHNHFHLMKIMRYSLWNSDRSAEVAPGQKVGFCLYDIEQASGAPVTDPPRYDGGGDFCRRGRPGASGLNMGVSPGWRDVYGRELALQWVDVSDTPPGDYYPASEADPDRRVDEERLTNNGPAYGVKITIPGYVARAPAGTIETAAGQPVPVTLAATRFGAPGARRFRVVSAPEHGTLNVATGSNFTQETVTYTPQAGYSGPDSFRFAAINGGGQFAPYPRTPVTATASLQVGEQAPAPTVTISGAPASLTAGTSAQLSATVSGAGPNVTWSASAGAIDADGLFTAPNAVPAGGSVTIRATSADDPGAFAEVTIGIEAAPPPAPAPVTPGTPRGIDPTTGGGGGPVQPVQPTPTVPRGPVTPLIPIRGLLTSPVLTRSANGRILVVRTTPRAAGRVTINIVYGRSTVARCKATARLGRRIVCKLTLPPRVASKSVRVVVALRGSGRANATVKAVAPAPRKAAARSGAAKAKASAPGNPGRP